MAVVLMAKPVLPAAHVSLAQIRAEIDAIRKRGKGSLELPPGEFVVSPKEGEKAALILPYGTQLTGAGRDQTRIVMASGYEGHVISAPEGGVTIADLTIDGNYKGRSGRTGHNIRLEGDENRIEHVTVLNACSYGIGLGQRRFVRRCILEDVIVSNTGKDGIDVKNRLARTEVEIRKLAVSHNGRDSTTSAALDLRGKCSVYDLSIENAAVGLRFRHGEADDPNGPGAHGSFAHRTTVRGATTAVSVVARDVTVENLSVRGANIGIALGAERFTLSEGRVEATRCIYLYKDRETSAEVRNVAFAGMVPREASRQLRFVDCTFAD